MSYKKEKLALMSGYEIDAAVHKAVSNIDWYVTPEDPRNKSGKWIYGKKNGGKGAMMSLPSYCSDWSVTGPLMVKYGVATVVENGKVIGATNNSQEFYDPFGSVVFESRNTNPLRAICEVILMMGESK